MKTFKIINICGTWSDISDHPNDTQILTITKKGFDTLCNGSEPKHLKKNEIIQCQEFYDWVETTNKKIIKPRKE